jgi:hypothetical protein
VRTEIFCGDRQNLYIYDAAGSLVQTLAWPRDRDFGGHAINVADFNGDGIAEVYDLASVRSIDGSWGWHALPPGDAYRDRPWSVAIELDAGSAGTELFLWNTLYAADGSILWQDTTIEDSSLTVGDFDGDGAVELVLLSEDQLQVVTPTGARVGPPTIIPRVGGRPNAMPMAADVDGDGRIELVLPVADSVRCLRWESGTWTEKWRAPVTDISGASSGMTFDFDGDGAEEIVYRDELGWYILDGRCGAILSFIAFPSLTINEFPVVANIDDDPSAEILVSTYSGLPENAMLIAYEIPGSCTPRSLMNEPAYYGTNVDDAGRIPTAPEPPWLSGLPWRGQRSETPRGIDGVQAVSVIPSRQACIGGAFISWDPARTSDGAEVLYDLFVVDGLGGQACCDVSEAGRLVSDLAVPEWFDPSARDAGPRAYAVVASRADGAACATAWACSAVVDVSDDTLRPAPSSAVLVAERTGSTIELSWRTTRTLLPDEHFHLRRSEGSATSRFDLVTVEGHLGVDWQGAMTVSRIEFYRLTIADTCEYQSLE